MTGDWFVLATYLFVFVGIGVVIWLLKGQRPLLFRTPQASCSLAKPVREGYERWCIPVVQQRQNVRIRDAGMVFEAWGRLVKRGIGRFEFELTVRARTDEGAEFVQTYPFIVPKANQAKHCNGAILANGLFPSLLRAHLGAEVGCLSCECWPLHGQDWTVWGLEPPCCWWRGGFDAIRMSDHFDQPPRAQQWSDCLRRCLEARGLGDGPHWISVTHSTLRESGRRCRVTFDNKYWPEASAAFEELEWAESDWQYRVLPTLVLTRGNVRGDGFAAPVPAEDELTRGLVRWLKDHGLESEIRHGWAEGIESGITCRAKFSAGRFEYQREELDFWCPNAHAGDLTWRTMAHRPNGNGWKEGDRGSERLAVYLNLPIAPTGSEAAEHCTFLSVAVIDSNLGRLTEEIPVLGDSMEEGVRHARRILDSRLLPLYLAVMNPAEHPQVDRTERVVDGHRYRAFAARIDGDAQVLSLIEAQLDCLCRWVIDDCDSADSEPDEGDPESPERWCGWFRFALVRDAQGRWRHRVWSEAVWLESVAGQLDQLAVTGMDEAAEIRCFLFIDVLRGAEKVSGTFSVPWARKRCQERMPRR